MRLGRLSGAAGLAVPAALLLFWLFVAPPELGGATRYSATVGNSMEPLFHAGDLAVVRPASSYRVGDVVLYQSVVLHRPVLHRIIAVEHGRYFFKGDNNDFVDPGPVTRAELLGRLWFGVPRAGAVLGWFGAPGHAAAVAAAATLFLLLAGATGTGRRLRRRSRRRRPAGARAVIEPGSPGPAGLRWLHRPRRTPLLAAGSVAVVLGAAALAVGLAKPTRHATTVAGAYVQSGAFSYSGRLRRPDPAAYPGGVAVTGQPLFLSAVRDVTLRFSYRFRSALPHTLHGTIALQARMAADNGWSRTYVLRKRRPFLGDRATVSATEDLRRLAGLITTLESDAGAVGGTYSISLEPVVVADGTLAGRPFHASFSPSLPFAVTPAAVKLAAAAEPSLPGSSAPLSSGTAPADALHPVEEGSTRERAVNAVAVARRTITVEALRVAGFWLLGLGLAALAWNQVRRRRDVWSDEKRIAFRHGCDLVTVVALERSAAVTEVAAFESLAVLARQSERPILHAQEGSGDVYGVDDPPRFYLYRSPHPPAAAPEEQAAPRTPGPAARRRALRGAGALLAVALAATLATSLTGTSTVPLSYAGVSSQAVAVRQLAPAQCSALPLTHVIVATAAVTTGTKEDDLILGRPGAGSFTYNGGGGTDCIVAGGGPGTTNTLNGNQGGDVCIGAPGATNVFNRCSKTY